MTELKTKTKPESILFICLGNICRSPAAEGIMKKKLEDRGLSDKYLVDSAGIGNWHVGQLPDIRMRRHGAAHGYTFDSRARQFNEKDFNRFDYIVTMDAENHSAIVSKASTETERQKVVRMSQFLREHPGIQSVPDPYYGGDNDFELVIELLEDACDGLIEYIEQQKTKQTKA